jgi:hypothetical protein
MEKRLVAALSPARGSPRTLLQLENRSLAWRIFFEKGVRLDGMGGQSTRWGAVSMNELAAGRVDVVVG